MTFFVHCLCLNRTFAVLVCDQNKLFMKEGNSEGAADSLRHRDLEWGEWRCEERYIRKVCSSPFQLLFLPGTGKGKPRSFSDCNEWWRCLKIQALLRAHLALSEGTTSPSAPWLHPLPFHLVHVTLQPVSCNVWPGMNGECVLHTPWERSLGHRHVLLSSQQSHPCYHSHSVPWWKEGPCSPSVQMMPAGLCGSWAGFGIKTRQRRAVVP